jgi:hypothetical protein
MLEQGSKETTKLKNRLLQLQNENQRNIQLRNQSDLRATETSCRLQQFEVRIDVATFIYICCTS